MTEEDGKWWVYGVQPAAIAENGESPAGALLRFRNRYREVLFDIAGEERWFDSFRREVESFFRERDFKEERRWEDALRRFRSENQTPPAPFSELPRVSPETCPPQLTVERLDEANKRFVPTDNVQDKYCAVAA
jgi:hypothetical protein